MFERISMAAVGLVGLLVLGCSSEETTSSVNIKTGGIAALIDVHTDLAQKATVHVELKVGGSSSNTYVALENGDQLSATAGDETKTLTVANGVGRYETSFSGVAADTLFSVVLERPHDTTAANNSGTLPAAFDLAKPMEGASRKNDDLEVTWAPSGSDDGMDFEFDGDCIYSYSTSASDLGTVTVPKGDLESTGGDKPTTCVITLNATRSRPGTADAAFDSESYFRVHQERTTKFSSAP